ncbi:hypothetical protein INT48_008243 [Thamnidium elegans]|uniref:Uncharacterized protein n=1 Tax=Thamnidium elegans TaxID=101142 RepID=A0A8H7SLE9_9FUNG|nr:hypothetical protein INT48_008243 [Thamnidium elegans]
MPRVNPKLDVNVRVSVSLRFIKDKDVREALQQKYDLTAVGLSFKGITVGRVEVNGNAGYEAKLDEAPSFIMPIAATCIRYLESQNNLSSNNKGVSNSVPVVLEVVRDESDDSDESEEYENVEEELDLTPSDGWAAGEVYIDSRIQASNGYASKKAKLNLVNARFCRPVDYFLFFCP